MTMTGTGAASWVAVMMALCSLTACSNDSDETTALESQSSEERPDGAAQDSSETGQGSGSDVKESQDGAASAAEQIASGEGLRVENETGDAFTLVFPNGDTALVDAGKAVVVLRPCRERLPLRAQNESGDLIDEFDGPCRRRDTWTVNGESTSQTTSEGDEVAVRAQVLILTSKGVGPLRLGMSRQEVRATEFASTRLGSRHDGWPRGCAIVQFRSKANRDPYLGDIDGAVSPRQGLESIRATRRTVTPEGIGLGSTVEDVRRAYPEETAGRGDLLTLRASPEAVYRIQLDGQGRVDSLTLELTRPDCVR
jgi:hypothetical protein